MPELKIIKMIQKAIKFLLKISEGSPADMAAKHDCDRERYEQECGN